MQKLLPFIFFSLSILGCASSVHKAQFPNAASVKEQNLDNAYFNAESKQECMDTAGCKHYKIK
jgi:hypothetical protein